MAAGEGVELLPQTLDVSPPPIRPIAVALVFLAIALANIRIRSHIVEYAFLAIQSSIGCFLVFLVFFSSLPATEWNWNIVVFNPLPLVLWRWRRWWALPYAAVVAIWAGFMVFWPHSLTDPVLIVLATSFAVAILRFVPSLRYMN